MCEELNRRDFLLAGLATAACASTRSVEAATLPTRLLGRTGQRVTLFGLGGASSETPLSNGRRDEAIAIVQRALDLGVNYFDTAATYGTSETYLGEVVPSHRARMFLASKSAERTRDGAWRELEQSLTRLKTDHLDLWQMHHVAVAERDTVPAFKKDGAIRAIEEAKAQKLIRYAGVSGHHQSGVLADWLVRYPFDTLLTVVNAADIHHPDSFIRQVLPVAAQQGVGVVAMKVPAYGKLLKRLTIEQAMHYSLSQPGVACCIVACDTLAMLEQNVAAASGCGTALSASSQAQIVERTASYWQETDFYRSWT